MKNKFKCRKKKLFWSIGLLFCLLPFGAAAKGHIFINEIFPNPEKGKGKEFVELYNSKNEDIELSKWVLRKTSKKGVIKKHIFKEEDIIKKGSYLKIKFIGLNNDGAKIELISDKNKVVDDKKYKKTVKGNSYNRDENNENNEWYWAKETGGYKNNDNPINKKYPNLIINEILPNPKGDEKKDEFIELYNPNKQEVILEDWRIRDGSKTGKYIFKKADKIKAEAYFVVYRKDFKFALNNSGGEIVKLIAPNRKVVSSVKYKSAKEGISYNYHLKNKYWRWSKKLTPKKENIFNNLPTFEFKKPNKIYKNTYVKFTLRKLRDSDGDKIKVSWNFGDGHKSYLKKTRHKYKKTGRYQVRLSVKDGSEEVIKVFDIKVKKYPSYKLKIVGIMPNPNGKDKGKEVIFIKNLDKKRVSLEGYKIGTGKNDSKILKHPFHSVVKIKSGKTKKIINDGTCQFSLLNKGGVVQLIYPSGKVADEVKYAKKKIFPNEMYRFDERSKQWHWQVENEGRKQDQIIRESTVVLGRKSTISTDITLDDKLGLCKTLKQMKRDSWADNWINKWLF
jgi:hypothetical protein